MAPRACLVTGYVRLDLPNRSHEEYVRLGERLLHAAGKYRIEVDTHHGVVEECWHWRMSDAAQLPAGNPEKDTRAFHAVMHEKTAWVADSASRTDAEILVWMDYGLLHVPGITEDKVSAFLERAAREAPRDRIGMASIWGDPEMPPVPESVAWHCAGGVFTVPRMLAATWHECVVSEASHLRSQGWITWEVNTWAAAWARNRHMVRPWMCDHDSTLLENGP
jgi:hypothetical protein